MHTRPDFDHDDVDDDDRARCDVGVVHLRITRHDRRRSSSKAATPNYERTFRAPFVRKPEKVSSSLALLTLPRLVHPPPPPPPPSSFFSSSSSSVPSSSCCPTVSLRRTPRGLTKSNSLSSGRDSAVSTTIHA
ncbi:hypothetical protein PUN28_018317 [Cardiocondyla obscurior]|uniref:Uncharacterized protein n=1 Tax=Cardiocondyla obscurior TaxID=286306 RepID=A0AAW2ELH4_9HYME